MQAAVAAPVAGLWFLGGVPAVILGLIAPRSWRMSASVGGGFISFGTLYVASGSLLLPAVVHSTGKLAGRIGPLAPTGDERGSGITRRPVT